MHESQTILRDMKDLLMSSFADGEQKWGVKRRGESERPARESAESNYLKRLC